MNEDEQRTQFRLHHLPFFVMWVASFGVAWMGIFLAVIVGSDFRDSSPILQEFSHWVYTNARWLDGLSFGTGLGAFLMLVQPWLMRWRYGFVPRFWRLTTFFGALLGGTFFSEFIHMGYFDARGFGVYSPQIIPIVVWFSSLTLIQTLALWPLVRRAVIYPLAGFVAVALALVMGAVANDNGISQMNMLLYGTIAQAVFSGALFLWLMRDYRVEAVVKRDEKSKVLVREGLHPISFIGLWTMAHLFGWVSLLVLAVIFQHLREIIPFLKEFRHWELPYYDWLLSCLAGFIIGGATALAQAWLMKQQSGSSPKGWLRLSLPAWTIASLALLKLMYGGAYTSYDLFNQPLTRVHLWNGLALLLWFGLPPLIQSFSLWREWRGAWLYALSGLVTAAVAYFIYMQLGGSYTATFYATIFGTGAQAILTGAAYLTILAQTRQNQAQEAETAPEAA